VGPAAATEKTTVPVVAFDSCRANRRAELQPMPCAITIPAETATTHRFAR